MKKSSVEKNKVEFRDPSLAGCELGSRGIEMSLSCRSGKKGIGLRKEDFMCDLKLQ
jgi:hypothetical protein